MVAGVSSANAQSAFYAGAGALGSQLEPRVNNSGFTVTEKNSAGARVFAGVDLTRRLSLEAYYSHLGNAELSNQVITGDIDYQAGGVSGLIYLYGNRDLASRRGFLAFARAGVGFMDNSSTNGIEFRRVNSEHFATGLGLEYGFGNGLGLRAEVLNHDVDARDFSVSLVKRFGGDTARKLPVAPRSVEPDPADDAATDDTAAPAETPVVVAPPPPPPPPLDSDADGVADENDLCDATATGASVAANGCVAPAALAGVNFASGSAALSQQASDALDRVIVELGQNPDLRMEVQSHTDNQGRAASNMELSRQRAIAVVRYLADVGGIDLGRLSAVGFGESQPLQSNSTAEGRQANRRVEIRVLQ